MFTRPKLLVAVSLVCTAIASARDKEYETFSLPSKSESNFSVPKVTYLSERFQIKDRKVREENVSVNKETFLFAKETYLSHKRDEAIGLLQQELKKNYRPNRENILLKLGQLYAEKYMELSFKENEAYTKKIKEAEEKGQKVAAFKPDHAQSQKYLKAALNLFTTLEREYPNHPKIDEVIFFIGFVETEYGNETKGKKYLERVINQYPQSRKVEEALLYLGDYYFEKYKFKDAYPLFQKLSRRTNSNLSSYGTYRMAWCQFNLNQKKLAKSTLKNLIEELEGKSNEGSSSFNLRDQALKDLVVFYGEIGEVDEAFSYFEGKLGYEKAVENLKLLADILRAKAQDEEASRAYEKLQELLPNSPSSPNFALGLAECRSRLGKSKSAVDDLVEGLKRYGEKSGWANQFEGKQRTEALEAQKNLLKEVEKTAFFYHTTAQKNKNNANLGRAVELYEVILTEAPSYPDKKKTSFYLAEALYVLRDYSRAADAYLVTAKTPPKDKLSEEAAYNALLSMDQLTVKQAKLEKLPKESKGEADLEPETIPETDLKFLEVAEFYLSEYPGATRAVEVRFRIASVYYRYHHYEKARSLFYRLALDYPRHSKAVTAANVVLDIDNLKKDYASLNQAVSAFLQKDGLGDKKFKDELRAIVSQVDFKAVEKLEKEGRWKEAGALYYNFYTQNPSGPLAEKALYNAYVSYKKDNDLVQTETMAKLYLQKFPSSPMAKSLYLGAAKQAETTYDYELALSSFLSFYEKFPSDKEAAKALYNAALFSELLEKNEQSLKLYDDYLKKFAGSSEKKAIQLSQAKLYRKLQQFEKMKAVYRKIISETSSTSQKVKLYGDLAQQFERQGQAADRDHYIQLILFEKNKNPSLKLEGYSIYYFAQDRFKRVQKQHAKYDEIKLRFPIEDLALLIKRKQKSLANLATQYDEVIALGVPEVGVAALQQKALAFASFDDEFKGLRIPGKFSDSEKAEIEGQLKVIREKQAAPLLAQSKDLYKACADKAAEFLVVTSFSDRCFEKVDEGKKLTQGIQPKAQFWTTRLVSASEG